MISFFCFLIINNIFAFEDLEKNWIVKTVKFTNVEVEKSDLLMNGVIKSREINLGKHENQYPIWLKGFGVNVLDKNNKPEDVAYLCHAWLSKPLARNAGENSVSVNLMAVSEGVSFHALPKGFGIKMKSGKALDVITQTFNPDPRKSKVVNYEVKVAYVDNPNADMKELQTKVMSSEGPAFKQENGELCLEDFSSKKPNRSLHFLVNPGVKAFNKIYKPGTLFTGVKKVHSIKLHIHPHAQRIEIRDRTANKLLWKGMVNYNKKRRIETVDSYSSEIGLEFNGDHDLEIITKYDNPLNKNIDGMGVARIYYR